MKSLNSLTPNSVAIKNIRKQNDNFHARYDAKNRLYRYTIYKGHSALYSKYTWEVCYTLNTTLFRSELECVLGEHDFNAFSVTRKNDLSTRCTILEVNLKEQSEQIEIYIRGDRFLHKMVRAIIGSCYDVARGKCQSGLVKKTLGEQCCINRVLAPASGLTLMEVAY